MTDSDHDSDSAGVLNRTLDELIQRFGSGDYEPEIARARAEYEQRRGRVFEDEPLWESWTQWFLEWYVVERVAPGDDYPLAARALAGETDPRRRAAIRAWITSHRSLFEVLQLRAGRHQAGAVLRDLLGGAEFAVAEQRALHGVTRGDVVEVRLVGFDGQPRFGRTLCFHPSGTLPALIAHARAIFAAGGERRDVIDFAASLRLRCERYRLPAVRIYETTAPGSIDTATDDAGDGAADAPDDTAPDVVGDRAAADSTEVRPS